MEELLKSEVNKLGNLSLCSPVVFSTKHTPKFSELDPNAHLSAPYYLNYILDHRFTGIREFLGLQLRELAKFPVVFIVREVQLKYLKSILADEEFFIESFISKLRTVDCDVTCKITGARGTFAEAKLVIACVDKQTKKMIEWPSDIISKFFHTDKV